MSTPPRTVFAVRFVSQEKCPLLVDIRQVIQTPLDAKLLPKPQRSVQLPGETPELKGEHFEEEQVQTEF